MPYTEVSASSGSIQITLRLLNRKPRVLEDLQFQLELKNIGTETLYIGDRTFRVVYGLEENSLVRSGTHLEMKTPTGGKPGNRPGEHEVVEAGVPADSYVPEPDPPAIELAPGEKVLNRCAVISKHAGRDWCALVFWGLTHPGRHKLRAVYDHRPKKRKPEPEDVLVRTPWISLEVRK